MTTTKCLLGLKVVLILAGCSAQPETIHLTDLKFESIFGTSTKDSFQTYCLLGTGFFRAPFSKNANSLIKSWMENHPDAEGYQFQHLVKYSIK